MGKEATIYLSKDREILRKEYNPEISFKNVFREHYFLDKGKGKYTPKIYTTIDELCGQLQGEDLFFIDMEFLDDYITLKDFGKNKKKYNKEQHNNLIRSLVKARYALGPNLVFKDLHLDNVMIKFNKNNDKVTIRFIDPGQIYSQNLAWLEWIKETIRHLKISRNEVAKIIIKNKSKYSDIIKMVGKVKPIFSKKVVDEFNKIHHLSKVAFKKKFC